MELGDRTLDLGIKEAKVSPELDYSAYPSQATIYDLKSVHNIDISKIIESDNIDPRLTDDEIRQAVRGQYVTAKLFVGIGTNPEYPGVFSGPFRLGEVFLQPGHSFWIKVENRWILIDHNSSPRYPPLRFSRFA